MRKLAKAAPNLVLPDWFVKLEPLAFTKRKIETIAPQLGKPI